MKSLPDDHIDAISLLESAGALENKLADIRTWPGLSGAQRAAATVLAVLQHLDRRGETNPGEIAAFLGISAERSQHLFDGVEDPPFELVSVGGERPAWNPSQRFEYGD